MMRRRGIAGFVFLVLIVYGLLVGPWPGMREAYAGLFRSAGDAMFGEFGSRGLVHFKPLPENSGMWDTKIAFTFRDSRAGRGMKYNAWVGGWIPVAACVALCLATPFSLSRRLKALLWGLVFVHGFVLFRVFMLVVLGFCGPPGLALFSPGRSWTKILAGSVHVVSVSNVTTLLVPVAIWILVAFRRGDWQMLFGPSDPLHDANPPSAGKNS